MGLFSRRPPQPVDQSLPSPAWFSQSEVVYRKEIQSRYGSPETIAAGGAVAMARLDYAVALLFFGKSIDLLHTLYGSPSGYDRRPGPVDDPIIDAFLAALDATMVHKPDAPVDEQVRETTHRLRSISTGLERSGVDATRYRNALDAMARLTPAVRTDDIFWV